MTVGQRIRVSRRACGLSLRDLEARIGNRVTAQAISKYERDESMPSSGVLIALADALGVPIDYLASDSDIRLEAVDFRKKQLTSRREEAQVEASVLHLLERYLTVEEILDLPTVACGTCRVNRLGPCCAIPPKQSTLRSACVRTGVSDSIPSPIWSTSWRERGIKGPHDGPHQHRRAHGTSAP